MTRRRTLQHLVELFGRFCGVRGELHTVSRSDIPGGGQRFGEALPGTLAGAALSLGQLFSVVGAKRVTLGSGFLVRIASSSVRNPVRAS